MRGKGKEEEEEEDGKDLNEARMHHRSAQLTAGPKARSRMEVVLADAVRGFRVTERAKAEMVQAQLVQFAEILKIKLRARLFQAKFQAHRLWNTIASSGGSFFVPEEVGGVAWDSADPTRASALASQRASAAPPATLTSSPGSVDMARQIGGAAMFFMPQGVFARLGFGITAILSLGALYRRLMQDMRPLAFVFVGWNAFRSVQLRLMASELHGFLNLLLAFEETCEDELENERIVRDVSEQVAIRHINHITKLSKNGQKTIATVIVDRICRHLSRHRFGYEEESPIWYVSDMQQFAWSCRMRWKQLTLPADRILVRPRLNLQQRVIRALTAETSTSDLRLLEIEPFYGGPDNSKPDMAWTAASILSRCAIFVHEDGLLYEHSQTDIDKYGFAYGTHDEVRWRKMRVAIDQRAEMNSKL